MNMVSVLEHCQVSPPPGSVSNKSLPLTFFDLPCLYFFPMQPLLFYESPISKDHFAQRVIPSLKHSLSLALKHFFPLAGDLVCPSNSGKPEISYKDGDSVTLTFAESGDDFYHFEQNNHPKYTSTFHALAPKVPPASTSNGNLVYPLMAIQVTHFPNQGICIGFTIRHVACDGTIVSYFMKTWGLITASGGKETMIPHQMLPSYDRTLVRDPKGIELETAFWNLLKYRKFGDPLPTIPRDMVRATFGISAANVEQLKKHVTALCGGPSSLANISAFTITCGYAWSCMVKARAATGEQVEKDADEEYFVIPANSRARITPPLPTNYFGNCLAQCFAGAKSRELMGEDGFVIATKSIGDAIHEMLHELEAGAVEAAVNWVSRYAAILEGKRFSGAVSSPKFGTRNVDFGWGKRRSIEILGIDYSGFLSLNDCMDGEGYTGIGISLPKAKMEAFASIFADGLKEGARLRSLL